MKKNIFVIFGLAILSIFCFTACNSVPSITGKFKDDEYIVSVDETIDFYDYLDLSGVEKQNVTISSSNEEILAEQEDGTYLGVSSGVTYVFVNYQGRVLANVKVTVKYKQSKPKNFVLSEDGVYSWDKSFVVIDGVENYASSYEIAYSLIDENSDPNRIEYSYVNTESNSYAFDKTGSYYVKVKAISSNKYVDDSEYTEQAIVNYGVMGILENVSIQNNEVYGEQKAVVSWDAKENALYDIYINGIKFFDSIDQNNFEYDYSKFKSSDEIKITIISKDAEGKLLSTKTTFFIQKLESPQLKYVYSNNDGYINWSNVENSFGYKLRIYDLAKAQEEIVEFENSEDYSQTLKNKEEGFYNLSLMALGGNLGQNLLVNSEIYDTLLVAKLHIPSVEIVFEGESASLTFEDDSYIKNYRIEWNNQSIIYNVNDGLEKVLDLSDLAPGQYNFTITALPTYQDGEVAPFSKEEYSTTNVLNSDSYIFEFYILDEFSEITHTLNVENGSSTIIVDKIENANYYSLFINNQAVDSNEYQVVDNGEKISIILNNLSLYSPEDDKYEIKVVAGRRDDENVEIAVKQEIVKELQILPIVSSLPSEEQENGSFKWNTLEQDAIYSYEIYKTEKDYSIETNAEPFVSGQTSEGKINETLEFGYYVIKIVSLTTDTNSYLNSNYYDKENYFTANFLVNKQIEKPSVRFENTDGTYKLVIETVEYGGGYDIYINGEKDGAVLFGDSQPEFAIYDKFEETFEEAKDYQISIIAHSGTMYDKFLHIPSEPFELQVTKLAIPTFNVVEEYNEDDNLKKLHEYLQVNMIENADYPVIKLENEVVNLENQTKIDMLDYSIYDTEFKISLQYIASKESQNNQYYLDSELKEINFKRVSAPTSISYSNGNLSFENNENGKVDNYFITLTIVNKTNGNYYVRFFTEDNSLTFDLQEKINELLETNENFKNTYKMFDYLQVEISSHVNREIENVYYLPSANGTTIQGQNKLDLQKLEAPVIDFDSETTTLSWNNVSDNTTYDIYVDDAKMVESYTSTSILLTDIGNIDWSIAKNVYVKSYNKSFLDSDNSNSLNIKKLQPISTVNVANVNGEWTISMSLLSDTGNISAINVNGSSDNVTYTQGGNVASFKLANFADTTDFSIQVIYKNTGNSNYYISSDVTTFTLVNLETNTFQVTLSDDTLSWNTIASDFIGESLNPLLYTIKVTNQGKEYYINLTDKSYSIQDIESRINAKLNENVQIQVTASVATDYTLTLQDGQAKGYYGQHVGDEIGVEKLDAIGEITTTIENDMQQQTALSQRLNASVLLKWDDIWTSFDNIQFKIILNYEEGEPLTLLLKNGDEHEDYKLTLSDGVYTLKLNRNIVQSGINNIDLTVLRVGSINSELKTTSVERLQDVKSVTVSDSGILTIEDEQNSSYLIQLSIQDKVVEKAFILGDEEFSKTIDLMTEEFLVGKLGAYTIKVIAFDNNLLKAPSKTEYVINGYKLEGIENIAINDSGNIVLTLIIDDFSNLVFTARTNTSQGEIIKEFVPEKDEGSANQFYVAMIDIIDLFKDVLSMQAENLSFDFTVRKAGSIDADWVNVSFNYAIDTAPALKREASILNDYIIFEKGSSDNTVGFRAVVKGSEEQYVKYYSVDETLGYWKESDDGTIREFKKEKDVDSSATFTECYGIYVSDLLSDLNYGEVTIDITRIGKEGQVYYQFNNHSFKIYKLNTVQENTEEGGESSMLLQDNILSWNWIQMDENEKYKDVAPTAYYLIFNNSNNVDAASSFKTIVYKKYVDLREVGLNPGDIYNINIIAVSNDNNIICSNPTTSLLSIKRYRAPKGLEVKDGKIVFSEEAMKESQFMQDIQTFFETYSSQSNWDGGKLYETMNKEYFAPMNFELGTINTSDSKLSLKFTLISGGAATNTVYRISNIDAIQLFPDFDISYLVTGDNYETRSYVTLLNDYANNAVTSTSTEIENFKNFVKALYASNHGIGDGDILFDDLGREIPAGEYWVSVIHTGVSSANVESDPSETYRMYLSYAPEVSLQNENIDGKPQYTINVNPVSTYNAEAIGPDGSPSLISKITAQKYKMVFRTEGGDQLFTLMISYNGNEWEISYNDEIISAAEGKLPVITNIETGGDYPSFKINMSSLKYSLNAIEEDLVKINQLMKVDIYAYLPSEFGYTTNGKSAIIYVNYLDLQQEKILFENGVFSIEAGLDSTFEVLVRYKYETGASQSFTSNFSDGKAIINFPNAGLYEYVILSINGSISRNTMNIESDTYAIENVFKLNPPELSTENNNLVIKYSSNNTNNMSTLKFMMGNDVSLSEDYEGDDFGYYYVSDMTRSDNGSAYYVGSTNSEGEIIYPSELTAQSFSAYFNGNTGTFTLSEDNFVYAGQSADHLLVFNEGKGRAILTSEINVMNARMLPMVGASNVEGGNYTWSEVEIEDTFTDESQNAGKVVYKIDVTYYEQDLSGEAYNKQREETYYSTSYKLDSSYITDQYNYYRVNVTTLIGIATTQDSSSAVKTIEGEYYTFNRKILYQDGSQVLRSQTKMAANNEYIVRTQSPMFISGTSNGISNGRVVFMINNNLYNSDEDTSQRISVVAEYTRSGKDYSTVLTGEYTFISRPEAEYQNYKIVNFTPDEGQLNNISSFTLKIYINEAGKLNSKPLVIENVYKLASVTSAYYAIGLDENGQTYINFDEYFNQISINNDYSCYKIVVTILDVDGNVEHKVEIGLSGITVIDGDGEEQYIETTDHRFTFTNDMIDKIINIQVQDAQGSSQINPKLLLNSDTLSFNIYKTSIEDLSLNWNEDKIRFEWNWRSENAAQYEFYTNLLIGGYTEQGFTNYYYYMPKRSGDVQSFNIRARIVNSNSDGQELYLFSDPLIFEGSAQAMLFSGGTGEQNTPYLISNLQDFLNISKRNESGQKFYFRLTTDITISDSDLYYLDDSENSKPIIDTFYGEFDGNGRTITFISDSIHEMEGYKNNSIPGLNSLTVDSYSSLFYKIGESGVVKNLLVNYNIKYNKVLNNTIAFAPIALYNYGTIDNIILNDMQINVSGNDENNILIGGIVALNYGIIRNCSNIDEMNYVMTQRFSAKFGYGGIALFNTFSGTISHCFNSGTKSITLTVANNIAAMAGITLTNEGKITASGNDSDYVINSSGSFSVIGYVSGITMSNSYGTLEYVYNNGTFSRGSKYETLNSAGIAYEIISGVINSLVETSGENFFVTCTCGLPTVRGTLYAKADSGVDGISTVALKETSINCGSTGYKLVITTINEVLKAKIQ